MSRHTPSSLTCVCVCAGPRMAPPPGAEPSMPPPPAPMTPGPAPEVPGVQPVEPYVPPQSSDPTVASAQNIQGKGESGGGCQQGEVAAEGLLSACGARVGALISCGIVKG